MKVNQAMVGIAIGIASVALIWWQVNWLTALGVLLAIYGNNLERSARDLK